MHGPPFRFLLAPALLTTAAVACSSSSSMTSSVGVDNKPDAGMTSSGVDAGKPLINVVELAASNSASPFSLAIDGTDVFWTNKGNGAAIYSVSETSAGGSKGGVNTAVAMGPSADTGIAVDDTSVYWETGGNGGGGAIVSAPKKGGGKTVTLASVQHPQSASLDANLGNTGVAVDDMAVYFATRDASGGSIGSVPKAGGTVVTLASPSAALPSSIALDDDNVYWVSDTSLIAKTAGAAVASVPKMGGATTTLVSTSAESKDNLARGALAIDATSLYWISQDTDTFTTSILKMPKAGGAVVTLLAPTMQDPPTALAVDATNVYWSNGKAVMSLPTGGGKPTTVTAKLPFPSGVTFATGGIAVDSANIYASFLSGSYPVGYLLRIKK